MRNQIRLKERIEMTTTYLTKSIVNGNWSGNKERERERERERCDVGNIIYMQKQINVSMMYRHKSAIN